MSRNKARNGSSKEENEEELAMYAQIKVTLKKLSGIQRRQQQLSNEIQEIEKAVVGEFANTWALARSRVMISVRTLFAGLLLEPLPSDTGCPSLYTFPSMSQALLRFTRSKAWGDRGLIWSRSGE